MQKGNAILVVLIVAVLVIAAVVAYQQGYLGGMRAQPSPSEQPGVELNIRGGASQPTTSPGGSGY